MTLVFIGRFKSLDEIAKFAEDHKDDGEIKYIIYKDNSYRLFFKVYEPFPDDHYSCCGCCEYMMCEMGECWCHKIRTEDGCCTNCDDNTDDFGRTCKEFRLEL